MSSGVDSSDQWMVQILFGRYRALGNFQLTHIAVLVGVGFTMIYIYLHLLRKKFRNYELERRAIPKHHIPMSRRDMDRHMFQVLVNEMVRVDSLLDEQFTPQAVQGGGDEGWGAEEKHFRSEIAKSYSELERTAQARRPGLRHTDYRTIRHYVTSIRKSFPLLKPKVCEDYIALYEKAVYGTDTITLEDYKQFKSVFTTLLASINERQQEVDRYRF